MLPLDYDLLMFVKFFIFVTCVFFWIKLGYDYLMRHHRARDYHRRHRPRRDDEDA